MLLRSLSLVPSRAAAAAAAAARSRSSTYAARTLVPKALAGLHRPHPPLSLSCWKQPFTTTQFAASEEETVESESQPSASASKNYSWVKGYSKRLSRYMRDGNYKKARNTLDILRKRGARKISQEYYYMAISACTKHGHVEHAFAVLEEMKADGLEPSILCYRRLIEGCAEHEPPLAERAIELLGECRQRSEAERERVEALKAETEARGDRFLHPRKGGFKGRWYISPAEYNAAIDACGFAGLEEKVVDLLVEMRDTGIGIDDDSFYCVRQAVDSDERWEEALALLREMLPKDRGFTY